jgi:hypothetical protein
MQANNILAHAGFNVWEYKPVDAAMRIHLSMAM